MQKFKFTKNNQLSSLLFIFGKRGPKRSDADILKEQYNLVPCKSPGFAEREKGEYWVRIGDEKYTLFVFINKRWYVRNECQYGGIYSALASEVCLSQKEYQWLKDAYKLNKGKLLTKEAKLKLVRYEFQENIRKDALSIGKCKLRFRDFKDQRGIKTKKKQIRRLP